MSIGPAPGVLDPDVGGRREQPPEARGRPPGRGEVVGERAVDPAAEPCPAAATADRDPPVRRGPQVVEREPGIGDPLAAGPADVGESLGDRLGQDDVRRPRHQPPSEPRPARRPRVERDDRRAGQDLAVARLGHRPDPDRAEPDPVAAPARCLARAGPDRAEGARPLPVDLDDLAALVDHHATLEQHAAQAAREHGRLDRRGAGHEHPVAEDRRADPRRDLRRGQRHVPIAQPVAAERLHGLGPRAILGRRGADRQRAGLRVPGIDRRCSRRTRRPRRRRPPSRRPSRAPRPRRSAR